MDIDYTLKYIGAEGMNHLLGVKNACDSIFTWYSCCHEDYEYFMQKTRDLQQFVKDRIEDGSLKQFDVMQENIEWK
jgi:hypothetical protein